MATKFKIDHIDSGFCRIVYNSEIKPGVVYYYCLQDEGPYVEFYRCSNDDYYEPSHRVQFKDKKHWHNVEIPQGEDELSTKVRNYINEKITNQ